MGFPDSFIFKGNKTDIAKQIGNAVPPNLAAAVASIVKDALDLSNRTRKPKNLHKEAGSGAAVATKRKA